MTSYPYVPVAAVSCYIFLLFSFGASRKSPLIKSYMGVLIAMILWTGGSFLMRLDFFPSVTFWYNISIVGLLFLMYTVYHFTSVFLNCEEGKDRFWLIVSILTSGLN